MPDEMTPLQLTELAGRIREMHASAEGTARSVVRQAAQCGELLSIAKTQIPHGRWEDWVQTNCEFSLRTAQVYMRVAKKVGSESKAQQTALLPLREVAKAFSEPKTEVEARAESVPGTDDEPEAGEIVDAEYEVIEEPDEPTPLPKSTTDGGLTLTSPTRDALAEATRFEELVSDLRSIAKRVKALGNDPIGVHLNVQDVVTHLKDAASGIKYATPRGPCIECNQKGCQRCRERGWLPRDIYNQIERLRAAARKKKK
jgi:hypothetical protein